MKSSETCVSYWPVDRPHESDHGEHSGHTQPHPGGGGAPVQIETDPGHHHYQAAGHVDLDDDSNDKSLLLRSW